MFGFASGDDSFQFVHAIEMEDGLFRFFSSEAMFVHPHELMEVDGEQYSAKRICCSRRAGDNAAEVIEQIRRILQGHEQCASNTYAVSEAIAVLAVDLACKLKSYRQGVSQPTEHETAAIVSKAMNRAYHNQKTQHPKRFGLASGTKSERKKLAETNQLDFVYGDDAVDIARCLRASRTGDTVTLFKGLKLSQSERTLFEWHGIHVNVAK